MFFQKLAPFSPVANGTRSTAQVPRIASTLGRIVLEIPTVPANSITKATISEIVVKIGSRVVFGPVSGAELDALNKYRGLFDSAEFLTIDLTERDGVNRAFKEIGGIDIPALGAQDIFVEVVNSAGAGNPFLSAVAGFTALQFDPKKPSASGQLMHKLLRYVIPSNGGTLQVWTPDFRGAILKRVAFRYLGTDWTSTTDGNLRSVLVRKNGLAVHDNIRCLTLRQIQQEFRKVPQSRTHMVDFITDNVHEAAMATARSTFQFDLTLGANDTVVALVECLDVPGNL